MAVAHPVLALAACGMYLGVTVACGFAARNALSHGSRRFWIAGGVFFAVLALVRGSGLENALAEALRLRLYQDGVYESRRDFQRPLAAGAVVVISAAFYLFYLKRPRPRAGVRGWARYWAMIGMTVMLGVIALRLISFHDLDRLLYGPVRMNWVLDIGSTVLVAWAAVRFGRDRSPAQNQMAQGERGDARR